MRFGAALLAVVLVAPAHSSGPRPPAPSMPDITIHLPPMIVPDSRWPTPQPQPEWIAAARVPEFGKCAACHNVEEEGTNGMGPNLYGVFGREAASQPNYLYSPALRESGLVWDEVTLDRWLADPRTLVPGSKMTFGGEKDPEKRKALIDFLRLRSAPRP